MGNILSQGTLYLKKDLLLAALIIGVLILVGSPIINSGGINLLLFWIIVFILWRSKRVNLRLLAITRVLQMVSILSPIALFLFTISSPNVNSVRVIFISLFGFLLQSAIYYHLAVWTKLLKEGQSIQISKYKRSLFVIGILLVIFIFFGKEIFGAFLNRF